MLKRISVLLIITIVLILGVLSKVSVTNSGDITGAPPYGEPEESAPELGLFPWPSGWERPNSPPKVGLQVGHYQNDELPEELNKLIGNYGSTGGGKTEWEVNLKIAREIKKILEQRGIKVEVLPATVPESYWADVFLAIHADGNEDRSKRGFKVAAPWRDFTKKANNLVDILYDSYSDATDFETDDNISRNMRGYYAFSWWKYKHAIHPMTTAAIIETGFLTNPLDRTLLVNSPEISAQGIADGILKYLQAENLL